MAREEREMLSAGRPTTDGGASSAQDVPLELPEADGGPLARVSRQRVVRAVAAHGHHSQRTSSTFAYYRASATAVAVVPVSSDRQRAPRTTRWLWLTRANALRLLQVARGRRPARRTRRRRSSVDLHSPFPALLGPTTGELPLISRHRGAHPRGAGVRAVRGARSRRLRDLAPAGPCCLAPARGASLCRPSPRAGTSIANTHSGY